MKVAEWESVYLMMCKLFCICGPFEQLMLYADEEELEILRFLGEPGMSVKIIS